MRASAWIAATLVWILVTVGACLAASSAEARGAKADAQGASTGEEPAAGDKAGKELHALRLGASAIRIDGRVDEEPWMRAAIVSDFVQEEPDNMMQPTETTTVRVVYDDRYLYVAVQMLMRDPADLRDGLARRGSAPPSDRVFVAFDTAHDHQNAYVFEVNASGVQNDYLQVEDTRTNNDYEAVWEAAALQTGQGWNAEFRIPFSQMRFPAQPGDQTVWGFNVRRDVFARGEQDWWIARPRGAEGVVSRFGHLVFDDRLAPPRRFEFTPYTLGQMQTKTGAAASGTGNAGFDLRVGLGSSANLSATVNPDFGQVEADPSVLNLSVFETFFPEKRPFFVEDSQSLVNSNFNQFPDFYSRRIGQTPNHFALLKRETLVRKPDTTTIVGAAKLTGGTQRWTYGALTARTSREFGTVDQTITAIDGSAIVVRGRKLIEPRAVYSVGRVLRNILGDTSNVGLIATSVMREKDLNAVTFGADATVRRDQNRFFWNTHWVETRAPVDGTLKYGLGGATNMVFNRKYYSLNAHYDHFDRSFHNTEIGFLQSRTNKNNVNAGLNLMQPDPHGIFRSIFANIYGGHDWTTDGLNLSQWFGVFSNFRYQNFWNTYFHVQRNFQAYDDLDTRGGPPIFRPGNTFYNSGFNSDSRKQYGFGMRVNGVRDDVGGWWIAFAPEGRFQVSSRLVGSVGIEYTSARDSAQWIKNLDTDGDDKDDQHVYGRLRRHVVDITGRATYSFTRDLTLEAYLQPFVAVGDYSNIGRLARPMSFDFAPVTLDDDPDFNRKSVRSTVVLRWEYVRGSTLFAVWNVSTSDEVARKGIFSPFRDLGGAFGAPGSNTLAIKLNFWFAR
jgi:hypothetical protein